MVNLFGRERELARIDRALSRARAGTGSLVLLTGPSGFADTLGQSGADESVLPFTGAYVLRYANAGAAAGVVNAAVALTPP